MPTSLEKFNRVIDAHHPELKKFIVHQKGKFITLEDWDGQFIFGSQNDLGIFFESPNKFNIKKSSVSYNEKGGYFTILLELI